MLVGLVMEQRYQAVLAVVHDGWGVSEVAERLGVSRQSVHAWIARYEAGGLAASRTARIDRGAVHTRPAPRSRRRSVSSGGSTRGGDPGGSSISWRASVWTRFRRARPSTAAYAVTA